MIAIANKNSIHSLSIKSLKANRMRNIFAVIAIALTSILFTTILTLGMSLMKSLEYSTMRQIGGNAHGTFKYLSTEEFNKIKNHRLVKELGYSIIVGFAENKELSKRQTEIRYATDKFAEFTFALPANGKMPERENEIATDTIILDKLGIPHELGQKVELSYSINGKKYRDTFILSGYWKGDSVHSASMVWVSDNFMKVKFAGIDNKNIKEHSRETGFFSGLIFADVKFSNSLNIESKMQRVLKDNGFTEKDIPIGVNWGYATEQLLSSLGAALGLLGMILLIIFSGYLIIFNIFYISVAKDTKFYGMLKTVGTTTKQLKKIVKSQARILSLIGIPLGLIIGYILGIILVPSALQPYNVTDIETSFSPLIFIFSALFSIITVSISCHKPAKAASKISPIEAVRYTEVSDNGKRKIKKSYDGAKVHKMAFANIFRNKKKAVVVMISLSISIVLLNSVYTIVTGFDMKKYLSGMMKSDFVIGDSNYFNAYSGFKGQDTLKEEIVNEIGALKGVEKIGKVYFKEGKHRITDKSMNWLKAVLENSKELNTNNDWTIDEAKKTFKSGEIATHINGIDEFLWNKFEEIHKGNFDEKKYATGNYVVLSRPMFSAGKNKQITYYDVGDTIKIVYEDGKEKTYEVMAVGDLPWQFSARHSHGDGIDIYLPANEFKAHVKDAKIMTAIFDVEDNYIDNVEDYLYNYTKNKNTDLNYQSRKYFEKQFRKTQNTYNTVGFSLSFVIALIGIFNFINSMATNVTSRRREYAMFQSIGMTGKQLYSMLKFEGLYYALFTILIVVTFGTGLNYLIVSGVAGTKWFFTYHFTLKPIIMCTPFLVLISIFIPMICYKLSSRMSIVERLREAE